MQAGILFLLIGLSAALYFTDPVGDPFYTCPFQKRGLLCPSCGGTRMAWSMLHLNFAAAFFYNPVLTVLSFPLAYVYGAVTVNGFLDKRILPLPRFRLWMVIAPLAVLLIFTALRNVTEIFPL